MKKEFKGFVCGVLITSLLGAGIVCASGTWENIPVLRNDITVVVDGTEVTADNFLYQDTTYLPIRAIGTALGENVEYDEAANTAYIGERIDNLDTSTVTGKYELLDGWSVGDDYGIYIDNNQYYISLRKMEHLFAPNIELMSYSDDSGRFAVKVVINGTHEVIVYPVLAQERSCILYDDFMEQIYPYLQ